MTHPYLTAPARAFWKKAVSSNWNPADIVGDETLIRKGERVASAGSCFAANIVPYIESAGFEYVRTERYPSIFGRFAQESFSYSKFSAMYGNIYTARQALQLLQRAQGHFTPSEDRWRISSDYIVDPFRPGLKYTAESDYEFDLITGQHLENVLRVFRNSDVFVFTLGLTEAWISRGDGAVFPACPGTVAGTFDAEMHAFKNFGVVEVIEDLSEFVRVAREINPSLRFILTVSPVPLVATATSEHVVSATIYSKSVLRAAAGEVAGKFPDVTYFPAYELVTGPQAPEYFFEDDRREPSQMAIRDVMHVLFSRCETDYTVERLIQSGSTKNHSLSISGIKERETPYVESAELTAAQRLSMVISEALCEEAAAELE